MKSSAKYLKNNPKRTLPSIKNPDRICVICKEKYRAVSPLQKTCSDKCREINDKKRFPTNYLTTHLPNNIDESIIEKIITERNNGYCQKGAKWLRDTYSYSDRQQKEVDWEKIGNEFAEW